MRNDALRIIALALAGWSMMPGAMAAQGSPFEFTRLPQSVRQQASGMVYGNYDSLKLFSNPAILAYQPKSWEAGLTGGSQFDGDVTTIGLAAGWMGQPKESGSYGFALNASYFAMTPFKEIDVMGNEVDQVKLDPNGFQVGAGGVYQWQFVSFGVMADFTEEWFGSTGNASRPWGGLPEGKSGVLVTAGAALTLGNLDVGLAYRGMGGPTELGAGAVFRMNGWFKGALGLDASLPMDSGAANAIGGGITWQAMKPFALHLSFLTNGGENNLKAGFTANYRGYTLDYCFAAGLNGQMGTKHLLALGWRFGADRVPVKATVKPDVNDAVKEAVKQALEEKAKEGPSIQLASQDRTMAVSNFEAQNVSAGDAAVISDMLRNQLVKQGAFNIVEKTNMEKVLAEQAFQQTGCTTSECAVKLGKLLNVKYLVVGSFGKVMESHMISMRVVDVETARIIYSDESEGKDLAGVREGIRQMAERLTEAVKKAK